MGLFREAAIQQNCWFFCPLHKKKSAILLNCLTLNNLIKLHFFANQLSKHIKRMIGNGEENKTKKHHRNEASIQYLSSKNPLKVLKLGAKP
ncbi:hypothetical protein B9Z55_010608 [Caenorhabditis nigoni]|uniref:Uncharacterized protein n=1 Tax=Caenorhabditis nigoni TaxID=1611254 RepID=A0A2G5UGN9_9PELO|nr:hypothetical protein B9Z55_010608 [Caenorhabditis nigoni]